MATRRPSVPKAQFPTGIGSAPGKPAPKPAVESATPGPGHNATPAEGGGSPSAEKSGSAKAARAKSGKGKAAGRERQLASGPNRRSHQDGVVHAAADRPVPARSFSGRLLVLGLVMGVVTLLLAPNVHTFLEQRAEITALRNDIVAKEAQQSANQAELARWDDPAYIKQQARDRVSMLMPGETGYWVYGSNGVMAIDGAAAAGKQATAKSATEITVVPWVDSLWSAVQESAKVKAPAPAPAG
ncbi:septum formation initiator family protein [Arthrobacter sp. LAPM80]|uniref:FtsB family cell division protein n=1 Tax=Arthrobacter sp. LAPM80 TaxID=3141788 RepID=UPI00398AE443